MAQVNDMEEKIKSELDTQVVQVKDLSDGCGDKYDIVVASNRFAGMATLARHRLMHSVLKEELKFAHAVTLHTFSIEEYEKAIEFQLPKKNVLDEMKEI